jgi:phosphatidylcholine synthase
MAAESGVKFSIGQTLQDLGRNIVFPPRAGKQAGAKDRPAWGPSFLTMRVRRTRSAPPGQSRDARAIPILASVGRIGEACGSEAAAKGHGSAMSKVIAWAVHLLTASGAALAFVAAVAVAHGNWQIVFLCLGIALIVDGIDGPIARRFRVKEKLPWFDGAALDFVVDYTNYVFVPALVLSTGGLLAEPFATIAGIVVAVVGALYFADKRMKTANQSFRGFPAIWNVLIYLLMIYKLPEWATLAIVAAAALLTFAPVEFIHPVRVERMRPLTLAITVIWGILAILALAADLTPGPAVAIGLAAASIYLAVIAALLQVTRTNPGI